MKIAIVAPIEESVPPKKYGGTEIVIYNLIVELVRLGHEVTLFGTGDSEVPCKIIPLVPSSIRLLPPFDQDLRARDVEKYLAWVRALRQITIQNFDVIHNHTGPRFFVFFPFIATPIVSTLHMPIDQISDQNALREVRSSVVSISQNQRRPLADLQYIRTVYNGIEVDRFKFNENPEDYLLYLARFSPHKGAREAIELAKLTNQQLYIAAKVDVQDQAYFDSCKGLIDGQQIRFIGEVTLDEKVKLLQNAKALLAPIQWEEPFGLYAVEAMACGTPVLGIARGSFPEIVVHGETGFLGNNTNELRDFIPRLSELSRERCRKIVEEKFTHTIMASNYISVYEEVIANFQAPNSARF